MKLKKETEHFNNKGCAYYNFTFRNCQHFVCDIEKILFGKIKVWHSFNYNLVQFFLKFFPDIAVKRLVELRKKFMAIRNIYQASITNRKTTKNVLIR